jgi:hypothetical protein
MVKPQKFYIFILWKYIFGFLSKDKFYNVIHIDLAIH